MSWKEFVLTSFGVFRFVRKISRKRWFWLPGSIRVIYDGDVSNKELMELGFVVEDHRKKRDVI